MRSRKAWVSSTGDNSWRWSNFEASSMVKKHRLVSVAAILVPFQNSECQAAWESVTCPKFNCHAEGQSGWNVRFISSAPKSMECSAFTYS